MKKHIDTIKNFIMIKSKIIKKYGLDLKNLIIFNYIL